MPKRPPTPPTDPTGKYLTVHQPYPPEPNMELLAHRKEVAFWVSNCLGNDLDLTAMYHKPRSDKIILEVRDSYTNWRGILGEHQWAEMLKNPTDDEKGMCSQIFYCRFSHDREVQKHGWKRIDVKESWYRDWKLINGKIVHPYPLTHYCDVPPESPTSVPLCRPLPVEYWPRPMPKIEQKASVPQVPGSLDWQKAKQGNGATKTLKNAKNKGHATLKAAVNNPNINKISQAPPGLAHPASSVIKTNPSNRQKSSGSTAAPSLQAPSPITPFPPGLNTAASNSGPGPGTTGLSSGSAWAPTPSLSPGNASVSGRDSSDSGSVRATPSTPDNGVSLEQVVSGMSAGNGTSAWLDEGEDEANLWGEGFALPASASVSQYAAEPVPEEPQGSLWADYDNEEEEEADPTKVVCSVHGKLCKKGICKEYKSQLRATEKAREAAERKQTQKRSQNEGGWRDRNARGDKIVYDPRREQRSKPAHLLKPESAAPPDTQPSPAANQANTSARERPAHLAKPAAAPPADASAPSALRPARGRRMNMNTNTNNSSNNPTTASPPATAAPPASRDTTGWGYIPRDPWGGSVGTPSIASGRGKTNVVPDDTKSVASSSTGGWGRPAPGPWDVHSAATGSARSSAGTGKGMGKGPKNKSWAEQMEEADDAQSVAESSTGGWGTVSNGPWS